MTDFRIVCCSYCDSEGRVLIREDYYDRQYGWQPGERDIGPCEACDGTGGEIIEVFAIEAEDLDVMAGVEGFEPSSLGFGDRHSAVELHP